VKWLGKVKFSSEDDPTTLVLQAERCRARVTKLNRKVVKDERARYW
jgi:hypothetical protein